jgi:hypothetical protein
MSDMTAMIDQAHKLARHLNEVNELQKRAAAEAGNILADYDLVGILERRSQAAEEVLSARRRQALLAAEIRQAENAVTLAKLDALAEMEQQLDYLPGKNEAARKQQVERWLATHEGYQRAKAAADALDDQEEHLDFEQARAAETVRAMEFLCRAKQDELRFRAAMLTVAG